LISSYFGFIFILPIKWDNNAVAILKAESALSRQS